MHVTRYPGIGVLLLSLVCAVASTAALAGDAEAILQEAKQAAQLRDFTRVVSLLRPDQD